jgi:general secretion pathway protein G
MRNNPNFGRRARGMSLLELVIVIILIGGLVAYLGSRLIGGQDRANYNLARTQLQTLASKVEQYRLDVGSLPPTLDALLTNPGANGWLGPYVQAGELKDPWQNPIQYAKPGQNGPFEVVSLGADGQPGGESVDADIRVPESQ